MSIYDISRRVGDEKENMHTRYGAGAEAEGSGDAHPTAEKIHSLQTMEKKKEKEKARG